MTSRWRIGLCLLTATLGACLDMDVTNPNNPSTQSVVESPEDIETLVATSFLLWFNRAHNNTPATVISTIAGEFSSGFADFGVLEYSSEPRRPVTVDPTAGNQPHRTAWNTFNTIVAGNNTALRTIAEAELRVITDGEDNTTRAQAFAKFTSGLSLGYIGLMYDQGYIYPEDTDPESLKGEDQVRELLRPYPEIMEAAIGKLQEARTLAEEHGIEIPSASASRWISGYDLSTDEFVRLINTYIARMLVYQARSPEERAAVEWERVISLIDRGITSDFAPVGEPGVMTDWYKQRAARLRSVTPSDFMRVNYEMIGLADQEGGFQEWWNSAWPDRTPFTLEGVEDRRIVDEENEPGKYMGYDVANIFAAERGTAHRSYYFFHRFGTGNTYENGPLSIVTVVELNLLKAEGLIRLGRAEGAVALINQTRVANGELAPVTIGGVPEGADGRCTPRKYSGECGSLWDALRWEKRIEGAGVEAQVGFYDQRGWGGLVENTPIHFPVPAQDQDLLELGRYSLGGGLDGSAPAPDPEQCPIALPRCP